MRTARAARARTQAVTGEHQTGEPAAAAVRAAGAVAAARAGEVAVAPCAMARSTAECRTGPEARPIRRPPLDAGRQPEALWVGDLETGHFTQHDVDATWNFEGSPVPPWPDLVEAEKDPEHVRQGSYASRFELRQDQRRQELIIASGSDLSFGEGDDLYFGCSLYVDSSFKAEESEWCAAVQWKNDGTGSPPLHAEVRNDGFHFTGGFGHPNGTNPTHDQLVPRGLVRGRWVDFVVRVVFSPDASQGWYEVFVDGERALEPQYPRGGTLYPNLESYHKHGLYCDPTISGSRVLWHDAWRIGRSYESVDPSWGRGAGALSPETSAFRRVRLALASKAARRRCPRPRATRWNRAAGTPRSSTAARLLRG
jgi:hypothetical protein